MCGNTCGEILKVSNAEDPKKWSVTLWQTGSGWEWKLFYDGQRQGTEGYATKEADAREEALKLLREARSGAYAPPGRRYRRNSNSNVKSHKFYTESDYKHLKDKGYTDEEIVKIWDRDGRKTEHSGMKEHLKMMKEFSKKQNVLNLSPLSLRNGQEKYGSVTNDQEVHREDYKGAIITVTLGNGIYRGAVGKEPIGPKKSKEAVIAAAKKRIDEVLKMRDRYEGY